MSVSDFDHFAFAPSSGPGADSQRAGLRFGAKGTHTSRTIMLAELRGLFSAVPMDGRWEDYAAAIVEDNCLGKPTASTRRLTLQRLKELYCLDPNLPIFCILRRLWTVDGPGRPLLALSAALARDPLLTATAPAVLPLPDGAEFQRGAMRDCLQSAVGDRLNESILDKVVRNAASSWTQSGHLEGRTFKFRRRVEATPSTVAFGLYLGYTAGFRGDELFRSEEHTSELQSHSFISYAVFCLKKKKKRQ